MSAVRTVVDALKQLFYKEVDDFNKEQRKKRLVPACPHCQAKCVVKCVPGFRCNQCGLQFFRCPKCSGLEVKMCKLNFSCPCGHTWRELLTPLQTRAKWLEENPVK